MFMGPPSWIRTGVQVWDSRVIGTRLRFSWATREFGLRLSAGFWFVTFFAWILFVEFLLAGQDLRFPTPSFSVDSAAHAPGNHRSPGT